MICVIVRKKKLHRQCEVVLLIILLDKNYLYIRLVCCISVTVMLLLPLYRYSFQLSALSPNRFQIYVPFRLTILEDYHIHFVSCLLQCPGFNEQIEPTLEFYFTESA